MSSLIFLDCEKQFIYFFKTFNIKGSTENLSYFQSATNLPTSKLTYQLPNQLLKAVFSFYLIRTLIIQVK